MIVVALDKPVKKSNSYLSRLSVNGKKNIKLNIPYGVLKQSLVLTNKQGYLVDIRVPINDYSVEYISAIEKQCIQELIKENANWFKNGLNADAIPAMLESCISRDTSLHIYASNIRSSGVCSEGLVSIDEWFGQYSKNLTKVSLKIVCDGLYIYPDKFGLRWIIQEIQEYQEPEDISPDIDELVIYWKDKAARQIKELETKKNELEQKIAELTEISNNLNPSNIDVEIKKLNVVFS
jgi:ribosome-associated translation inhibitor RaiA